MIDYSRYELNRTQRTGAILFGAVLCSAAVWLLCRQPAAVVAALPAGLIFPRLYRDHLLQRRKDRLRLQFKEMLQVLSSLLSAGRSVENAFLSLETELAVVIGDYRSDMLQEIKVLSNGIRNGQSLESQLQDFASRSGLEEVRSFADAFAVCKRAGGDLVEIIRRTSQLIGEKLEVELEVAVLISQKKFESRIMMVMPFALIGFLGMIAPDYMEPLRHGAGWFLLAVCLLLLAGCCWWMKRIMSIEV